MKSNDLKFTGLKIVFIVITCLFLQVSLVHARMITQLTPTLTVTQEYNDNYFQTENNTFEEWITSYELGFTMGFLNKKSQVYLKYNPEYKDYKNLDERDGLVHNASLDANFQPTKHTTIKADLAYDGNDGNNEGDSWEHSAGASIDSQLTKTLKGYVSQSYSKSYDQQLRTGDYKEHQTNKTSTGIKKTFGEKNSTGFDFLYEFDEYDNSDADEYTSYQPSAYLKYWFTRLDGMETNIEYEDKDFDSGSENDYDTIEGDIRYIRKFSRHLDGYIKYRHYLSDRTDGDHTIYHPSVGVDWDITEDSGVSIGIGVLFHEWDNENDDSQDPFIDLNAYKIFNFSPRGSLSITGSSKYDEGDEEAASLGFNITYRAGFSLDYRLTKRLNSNLYGYYKLQDFQEEDVDRRDDTAKIGAGITWAPLKWLELSADASHTNFDTDGSQRDDYEENKIFFMIRLIPEKPIRPDKVLTRKSLENDIFDR